MPRGPGVRSPWSSPWGRKGPPPPPGPRSRPGPRRGRRSPRSPKKCRSPRPPRRSSPHAIRQTDALRQRGQERHAEEHDAPTARRRGPFPLAAHKGVDVVNGVPRADNPMDEQETPQAPAGDGVRSGLWKGPERRGGIFTVDASWGEREGEMLRERGVWGAVDALRKGRVGAKNMLAPTFSPRVTGPGRRGAPTGFTLSGKPPCRLEGARSRRCDPGSAPRSGIPWRGSARARRRGSGAPSSRSAPPLPGGGAPCTGPRRRRPGSTEGSGWKKFPGAQAGSAGFQPAFFSLLGFAPSSGLSPPSPFPGRENPESTSREHRPGAPASSRLSSAF